MSIYHLLNKAKVTQAPPSATNIPSNIATPSGLVGNAPPQSQSFQLSVTGAGFVSATAQIYVSDDQISFGEDNIPAIWSAYGDPISATGFGDIAPPPSAISNGIGVHRHYCAVLTAISGTNASALLRMSC